MREPTQILTGMVAILLLLSAPTAALGQAVRSYPGQPHVSQTIKRAAATATSNDAETSAGSAGSAVGVVGRTPNTLQRSASEATLVNRETRNGSFTRISGRATGTGNRELQTATGAAGSASGAGLGGPGAAAAAPVASVPSKRTEPPTTTLAWKKGGLRAAVPEDVAPRNPVGLTGISVVAPEDPEAIPVRPPVVYYPVYVLPADERCSPDGPSRSRLLDWWRQSWISAWLNRDDQRHDVDRPAVAPLYLRSPLLSGFYGRGETGGCEGDSAERSVDDDVADQCVVVKLTGGAADHTRIKVPLPQLGARNARQLADAITHRLTAGEIVVLLDRELESFTIDPAVTTGIRTKPCERK